MNRYSRCITSKLYEKRQTQHLIICFFQISERIPMPVHTNNRNMIMMILYCNNPVLDIPERSENNIDLCNVLKSYVNIFEIRLSVTCS